MNKLSNEDLPANADSVSQSTDDHKTNNTNGESNEKHSTNLFKFFFVISNVNNFQFSGWEVLQHFTVYIFL